MKPTLSIFFFLAIALARGQGFTSENISEYTNKTYYNNFLIGAVELKLNADKTFSAVYNSGGNNWSATGTWQLNGNKIALDSKVCEDNQGGTDCKRSLGRAEIELVMDDQDLDYEQYIQVTSFDNHELLIMEQDNNTIMFGVPGWELAVGTIRNYNGTEISMMGNKSGTTTTGVKIRETPSIKGKQLKYSTDLFGGEELDVVPKGTEVTVIARTTYKEKVDKYQNYWYLVNVGASFRVWMFGEFVKL